MAEVKVIESPVAIQTEPPICVDLDGTLIKSDSFYDSLAVLARREPLSLLRCPLWVLKGKAYFKAQIAARVTLDAANLPYNRPLLDYLRAEHSAGRHLYLATGADGALANRIASHLRIFDGVMASDGSHNLTGNNKLSHLQDQFAEAGFDYIGNGMIDVPLLQAARSAMIANPALGLSGALRRREIPVARQFQDRSSALAALIRALRVHQWAKNLLVFLPLLLAHTFRLVPALIAAMAFFCLSFVASATYILNDLLDLEHDRVHLVKRRRAFAAGDLSVRAGAALSFVLLSAGLGLAYTLPLRFFCMILLYLATTVAYSFALKRIVLVDVIVLSALYTVRLVAGGAATQTTISPWLAAFSTFFFVSLAMVKRFSELQNLNARGANPTNARGYLLSDTEQLRTFGTASGYASIVIFTLYINGRDVAALYHHPSRMWMVTPLLILWVSRVWLLASRGLLDEDPVVFALTDRMSLLLSLGIALIAWSAL